MNDEEKFRKKLLGMLDENQYAYDADNWEKASQVLDQEDSGRRRRFLYILLFMGLGLAVGGYLLFISGDPFAEKLAVKTEAHPTAVKQANDVNSAEKVNTPLHETQTSEKTPSEKPGQTPATNEPQPLPETKPQTASTKAAKAPGKTAVENVTKAPLPLINPVKSEQKENAYDRISTKTRGKAEIKLTPVINSGLEKENTDVQAPVVSKPAEKAPGTVVTEDEKVPETKPVSGKEDVAVNDNLPAQKQPENTTANNSGTGTKKTDTANDKVSSKQQAEETSDDLSSGRKKPEEANDIVSTKQPPEETPAPETPVVAGTKKDSIQQPLAIKDSAVTKKPDSAAVAAIQPTLAPQPASNYCFAEAGGFFNLGWNYKGTREGMGINPYLGLSYMMELSAKTKVSAGIYYTTVSGLALGSKTITSSRIVFGEEKDVIVITPQRINYVSVPLKFYYAIGPKHSLSFGFSVNYLLDVQSKVTTHTEQLNSLHDEKTYRTGGYVEGFRTFNTQIGAGYRRSLYKNLSVNADILFGLGDLRDDVFSGIPLKERMSGLRLSLTYDLIKK